MPSIWKLAKQMEKQGKTYYERLAKSTKNPDIAAIFTFLAKEEAVHLATFEKMEKGVPVAARRVSGSTVKASKLFGKMAVRSRIADEKEGTVKAYKEALSMEKQSVKYYAGMLKTCDEVRRTALALIVEEEKKHVVLMEALIDFARKPQEWLENAEFNHLDEY
ncbi:MAG: ferritin family protein [Chitinispirillaceae bacterium]|nr:ferritin family protein [Chitinispirillaceae bacterium]